MSKQTLPVNYVDDVMASSMSSKRRWQITQNSDGTYNIEDVTTYDQVGSEFGAGDINATNQAVNESADAGKIIDDPDTAEATTEEGYIAGVQLFNHVTDSLTASDSLKFQFATDGEGNYGFLKGDDTFVPFKSYTLITSVPLTMSNANSAGWYKKVEVDLTDYDIATITEVAIMSIGTTDVDCCLYDSPAYTFSYSDKKLTITFTNANNRNGVSGGTTISLLLV